MTDPNENSRKLTGAAAIIMAATFLSRITGFLRTLLIYTKMRPNGYSDEFILAFTLPDIVYDLLAGGAIAAALIPVLSTYITKNKENIGWKAVSTFMNLTVLLMVVLEIIFFTWTDGLLGLLAAGYNRGTGDKTLLISLTRILLLSAPFMMLAGQCNGILNSYKRFAVAAFGPVIYNVCTIVSIAAFGSVSAELTAWGVVFSAAAFFAIQMASTMKHFKQYKPRLYLKSKAFRGLLGLAIPSLVSSFIFEINLMVSRGYATYSSEGMLTLLTNANRTWQLPLGIFAQSVGIALLPTLSEHHATDSGEEFKNVLNKGMRVVFLMSLPTALYMMILSQDIMRVLFKWGSLSETDVFYAGISLLGYSFALIFSSMIAMLTRAFYAVHNSRIPMIAGILGIAANYLCNWVFGNFTQTGIGGTALSFSISSFVNMSILFYMFKRLTGIDIIRENGRYTMRALFASIPSGIVVLLVNIVARPNINSKLSQIICIIAPLAAGGLAFWYLCVKIKIPEIDYVNRIVSSKLRQLKLIPKKEA